MPAPLRQHIGLPWFIELHHALWKGAILATIEPVWIAIGLVIAFGIGIMIAVTRSDRKTIETDCN